MKGLTRTVYRCHYRLQQNPGGIPQQSVRSARKICVSKYHAKAVRVRAWKPYYRIHRSRFRQWPRSTQCRRNSQHSRCTTTNNKETSASISRFDWLLLRVHPSYSAVATPLTELTKKGEPKNIRWWSNKEAAFERRKTALTSKPILRLPQRMGNSSWGPTLQTTPLVLCNWKYTIANCFLRTTRVRLWMNTRNVIRPLKKNVWSLYGP